MLSNTISTFDSVTLGFDTKLVRTSDIMNIISVILNLWPCYGLTFICASVIACGFSRNAFKLTVKASFAVESAFVTNFYAGFVRFYEKLSCSVNSQACK